MILGYESMSDFLGISGLTPQRCNYCCYQIMLADPLVYPTPKSTRILTNVSGWVPRKCPDLANHDAHTAVISGPNSEERPSFFGIPEGTCVFMTPEELHLDIASAAIQKQMNKLLRSFNKNKLILICNMTHSHWPNENELF